METQSKTRAAVTIAVCGLFIVAVVTALGVALGFLVHSAIVGTALPALVIIGLLVYLAWRVKR